MAVRANEAVPDVGRTHVRVCYLASGFEQVVAERMGHSFHTGLLMITATPWTCLCGFQALLLKQHYERVI